MPRYSKAIGFPLLAAWAYGLLYLTANRAVYYPLRHPRGNWELEGALGAENVWLQASDGVKLHAWWLRAEGGELATLFLHGNGGNLTHVVEHLRAIRDAGSSVLALEYRGYGKSGGRPTENGLYADAEAGYAHLRAAGFPARRIVIQGLSLGTAVAVDLASRHPCAAVVLEAPFPSIARVAAGVIPVLGPMLVRGYDSAAKIGRLRVPKLFIHGTADRTIPIALGRQLYDAAPQPKTFWAVASADHNDLIAVAWPEYVARLHAFYQGLATGS